MKEHTSNTLFTADWMGAPHADGECLCSPTSSTRRSPAQIARVFRPERLRWLQYCDPEPVFETIDDHDRDARPGYRLSGSRDRKMRRRHGVYGADETVIEMITTGERLAELK